MRAEGGGLEESEARAGGRSWRAGADGAGLGGLDDRSRKVGAGRRARQKAGSGEPEPGSWSGGGRKARGGGSESGGRNRKPDGAPAIEPGGNRQSAARVWRTLEGRPGPEGRGRKSGRPPAVEAEGAGSAKSAAGQPELEGRRRGSVGARPVESARGSFGGSTGGGPEPGSGAEKPGPRRRGL